MALQGTIDAFPVVDVLNLLAGSHKTGRLIVEGDRSTAQLFVLDGAVTGGGVQGIDEAPLADVVAELLRYSEGSFLFEPGTLAPAPQEPGDLISLVETQLAQAMATDAPLPEPSRGRVSRRVKSFPITPRVSLQPDERAQRWLLSVSTSDRSGLLYAIARVLARHGINLQLAKVSTLGERVEDTFLVNGPALQQTRAQLQIESELLDALAPVR